MTGREEALRAEAVACVALLHGEPLRLALELLRDIRNTQRYLKSCYDSVKLAESEVREREAAIQLAAGVISPVESFEIPPPCDSEVMPLGYATPPNDEPTSPETPRAKYLSRDVTGRRT